MQNDKGHISVDEIRLQQQQLEQRIADAMKDYEKYTGLYPTVEIIDETRENAIGIKVPSILIKVSQSILP